MEFFGLGFVSIMVAYAAYHAGIMKERKDWNKLIEKGVLPRPKGAVKCLIHS